MADSRIRTLNIKTNIVKRLVKERDYYEKDVEQQRDRIERMKAEGRADEYDVRKQEEVLHECQMMVPDCLRRLHQSVDSLRTFLVNEPDLHGCENYAPSVQLLHDANQQLPNPIELNLPNPLLEASPPTTN